MPRKRNRQWVDKRRVTFTVSFDENPEVLAFLHAEDINAGRLCARLLREHLRSTGNRCADLTVCGAVRAEALMLAARAAPPQPTSREEPPPTQAPAAKAASTAAPSATAPTKQAAKPRDTAAEKPGAADSGANSAVIKAFLS